MEVYSKPRLLSLMQTVSARDESLFMNQISSAFVYCIVYNYDVKWWRLSLALFLCEHMRTLCKFYLPMAKRKGKHPLWKSFEDCVWEKWLSGTTKKRTSYNAGGDLRKIDFVMEFLRLLLCELLVKRFHCWFRLRVTMRESWESLLILGFHLPFWSFKAHPMMFGIKLKLFVRRKLINIKCLNTKTRIISKHEPFFTFNMLILSFWPFLFAFNFKSKIYSASKNSNEVMDDA